MANFELYDVRVRYLISDSDHGAMVKWLEQSLGKLQGNEDPGLIPAFSKHSHLSLGIAYLERYHWNLRLLNGAIACPKYLATPSMAKIRASLGFWTKKSIRMQRNKKMLQLFCIAASKKICLV